jgi:hypothetical protein
MKNKTLAAILILAISIAASIPVRSNDTVLWLARSCVGEAGWNAWDTGECAAILHLYKRRSEITGEKIDTLARRYSAAIKPRSSRNNKWVLGLQDSADRPHDWPSGAKWSRYRFHWIMTLLAVELFMLEMVEDPLPNAWHYGCKFDTPPEGSVLIKTQFKNRWWKKNERKRNKILLSKVRTKKFD